MRLEYRSIDNWPPLAWLATWHRASDTVEIFHGRRVETRDSWFGEIVWDGDFQHGDFDQTDVVYGSGARLRRGELRFVASSSALDRLHWLNTQDRWWVSNSLACLLAANEAKVDASYLGYYRDFQTIIHGFARHCRTVRSSAGKVGLTYFQHLTTANGALVESPKVRTSRDYSSFGRYRGFLEEAICRLAENAACAHRRWTYDLLATVSTGYDSPTVAALARQAGLRQTLSFDRARSGQSDSGAEIARHLGLEPTVIGRDEWRERELPEVPFLAADAKGEDVYFAGAEDCLAGRLVLTGFGASRVWKCGREPNDDFRRGDQSGLSLAEYRLWCGFLHCPVPSIGSRQTADLYAMLESAEMSRWHNGTAYNKPFCRRVLEEAGVPGDIFGTQKKAASVLLFDRNTFLTAVSQHKYHQWREQAFVEGRFSARNRFKSLVAYSGAGISRATARTVQAVSASLSKIVSHSLLQRISRSERLATIAQYEDGFRHLFPWAIEQAMDRYFAGGQLAATRPCDTNAATRIPAIISPAAGASSPSLNSAGPPLAS